MTSLAEQIAQLTNPTPNFRDPEDGIDDETSARVVSSYAPSDFYETSEVSRLRKKVTPLLADTDVKYAGRRISRQKLQNDSIDSENGDDYSSESEGSVDSDFERKDSEFEDSDLETFKVKLTGKTAEQGKREQSDESPNTYEEDSEDSSDEEIDDDVEEDEDDKSDVDEEIEEDDLKHNHSVDQEVDEDGKEDLQNFSKSDLEEEKAKGVATRTQLSLWDSLLEGRIKVQKALILANQLPQPDSWSAFSEGQDFVKSSAQVQAALSQLENAFAELQTILLQQNPETKNLLEDSSEKTPKSLNNDDDEEITSESEVDNDEDDTRRNKKQTKSPDVSQKRKIEMDEFPDFLAKRHKAFHPYRNNVIQKWNDKTKLAAGKVSSKSFSAFEQTALKQIEQILSDKERLLKRTQLKRTTYNVLGKEKKEEESTEALDQLPNRDHLKDYDEQIFDDDDFYHQLLRELIERKTSDLTDPVAISRQWLEIQKLRSKSKKKVDTKASKGRKIRYNTLNKLVNFMAPQDTTTWTDESKDDLFTSLFGKRFQGTTENPVTNS